jgi:hypothetical protein
MVGTSTAYVQGVPSVGKLRAAHTSRKSASIGEKRVGGKSSWGCVASPHPPMMGDPPPTPPNGAGSGQPDPVDAAPATAFQPSLPAKAKLALVTGLAAHRAKAEAAAVSDAANLDVNPLAEALSQALQVPTTCTSSPAAVYTTQHSHPYTFPIESQHTEADPMTSQNHHEP